MLDDLLLVTNDPSFSTLSLMPLSSESPLLCKTQKSQFLTLLNTIIERVLMGLNEFKKGNFTQFDAQIGENLCQVRAYHITFLAQKYGATWTVSPTFQSMVNSLESYQTKLKKVLNEWNTAMHHSSQYDKNLDAKEQVSSFMERFSLLMPLHPDILCLAACYFLAQFSTKSNGILQSISLDNITTELLISKSQAKKLVNCYQNLIGQLGFHFINTLIDELPQCAHYKKLLPELLKNSDDSRIVLPCFVVSEIIFHHALKTQTPILLSVKRINSISSKDKDEVIYFLISGNQINQPVAVDVSDYLDRASIIIEAEVDYSLINAKETTQEY